MDQILVIIEYQSSADQVTLVRYTKEIYAYYENEITDTNAMIAVVNNTQRAELLAKGYYIQTIEESAHLDNYVLLQNEIPDQGHLLSNLGDVYKITDTHTLVRLPADIIFDSSQTVSGFFRLPLDNKHEELALANNVRKDEYVIHPEKESQMKQEIQQNEVVQTSNTKKNAMGTIWTILLIGVIIFVILFITFKIIYEKKKREKMVN